jgi:hypothetical protein
MMPERSGIVIRGDYLHGRDKDDLAWAVFETAFDRIVAEHGPDMTTWPYEPELKKMGRGETMLGYMPLRNTGMFWGVTELGPRIRHLSMLVPGQSGLEQSPHFGDQMDLFIDWQYKQTPYYPEDFPPFPDETTE